MDRAAAVGQGAPAGDQPLGGPAAYGRATAGGGQPAAADVCANCAAPLFGPYCAQCGQKAAHRIVSLRSIVEDAVEDQLSLNAAPVATLLNVPVADVFGEAPPREWGERTIVCHDGHLGFDRGLVTMVKAVHEVSRTHAVVLRVVGDVRGEEAVWLERYLEEHSVPDLVERTGWLPYEQVGAALAPCHIGLIALQERPNNVVTSSNKVFNYMLYGIPFVAPSFRLAKIKLVREERCGVLADSSDPASYARALRGLIEDRPGTLAMMRRALRASREKYRWEHMEPRLYGLYESLLNHPA